MSKPIILSKEEQFSKRLESIYSNNYLNIISAHNLAPHKTFRVNNLKTNAEKVLSSLKSQGFDIIESDLKEAYICLKEPMGNKLSETVESVSMQIYIQELSSMIPVLLLDLTPQDKVLDLCAAPGSKTTQIADRLENKGEIIANEQNRDRFFKLMQIIKDYGAIVKTINENGKILP